MPPKFRRFQTEVEIFRLLRMRRRKKGIHRHQTPPRSRNAARGSRFTVGAYSLHVSSYGPLRPNVTSSIKPKVHNVSQHRQRRTEPRPHRICTQNVVKISRAVPEICSRTDRQTDTQTHRQADRKTLLRPYRGE